MESVQKNDKHLPSYRSPGAYLSMYSTDSNSDKIMTMKNNAEPAEPFNSQDLIVNSPFWLLQISK